MRPFRRWWLVVPPLVLVFLAGTVYLPYYSLGPGPARAVEPLIRFEDHQRYDSSGAFVLTSVAFRQLTALGVVRAWIDPSLSVVGREVLFGPGETAAQEQQRAISQMDQSKIDAAAVVLDEVTGYPKDHGDGVLVEGVQPGCAADGKLFVGDVIHAVDGRTVTDLRETTAAIGAAPAADPITFDVTVDGAPQRVTLTRAPCGNEHGRKVGVYMIESFPFPITISSGSIGGVQEKVRAADAAGASVLIVPTQNLADARSVHDEDVRLVPVASFDDALAYLRGAA